MKNCHQLKTYSSILVLLFSWSGFVLDVQGQQQFDDWMPREFSEREAMQTIGRLQSKMYKPSKIVPVLKLQLDVLKSEVTFHYRMSDELEKWQMDSKAQSIKCNQLIRNMILDAETEMTLVDRETTALQMRNCVIELQRIEWEIATEKGLPESEAPDAQIGAAQSSIEARKAELEAFASELQSLKERTVDGPEMRMQIAKVKAAEANIAEARARLTVIGGSTKSESAVRVSQLIERKKAISMQLEMLKKQREVWMSIESKQEELSNLRRSSDAISEVQIQSDLKQLSRQTTIAAIEDAIKNVGVDNADSTTQPNN
jgi:hypothetical protein